MHVPPQKIGIFPDLNPGLVGIPGFGESGIPVWSGSRDSGNRESRFGRDPGIRGIGNPDLAGIGKINPDARASGISGSVWYCNWFMLFMTLDMPDEGTR